MCKVALLLIGRITNFEKTYSSLFNNLINFNNKCKFDIYILTWKCNDIKLLKQTYKPYFIKEYDLNDYKNHLKKNNLNDYSKIDFKYEGNLSNIKLYNYDTCLIQFFFLYNALNILKKSNKKYDIVIKCRFDIEISEPLILNLKSNIDNCILCPKIAGYYCSKNNKYLYKSLKGKGKYRICDLLFYGNYKNMLLLTLLSTYFIKYKEKMEKKFNRIKTELLFAYNFIENNVNISTFNCLIKIIR